MSRQSKAEIERKGQRSNKGVGIVSKLLGRYPDPEPDQNSDDD